MGEMNQLGRSRKAARLWAEWTTKPTAALRHRIITHYSHLVPITVSKSRVYIQRTEDGDKDDLNGAGYIGLCKAVDKFDPSLGNKFETFAITKIRGEVMEYQRNTDWVPRTARNLLRHIDAARANLLLMNNAEPTDGQVQESLALTDAAWNSVQVLMRRCYVHSLQVRFISEQGSREEAFELEESIPSKAESVETQVERLILAERIADSYAAICEDSPQHGQALNLHLFQGVPHIEVARRLGISASCAYQIYNEALESLRHYLKDAVEQ